MVNILVLNAGSSSLKFRLLKSPSRRPSEDQVLADGLVEKWGTPEASLSLRLRGGLAERSAVAAESAREAAAHAIRSCQTLGIEAIGYRVVHGGPVYAEPVRVTPEVIEGIRAVSHLAPLHNLNAVAGMEAARDILPQAPGVAVFDTAFHRTMPPVARRYAIPLDFADRHGLRRYGFHGISHQYVSGRLVECLGRGPAGTRLLSCHLGNGASICAVRDGQSVDTSMGFTPMEGLVMGTRSGDIDPGLVLHLIRGLGMTADAVDALLNRQSGLAGLSGRGGDVRDLEQAARAGDARAELALECFAYRAKKYVGAYTAVLGGLEAIAFTGGIGEHSADCRRRICRGLEFLGIELDDALNSAPAGREWRISPPMSPVQVWIIPTDEEWQIAQEVSGLLRRGAALS